MRRELPSMERWEPLVRAHLTDFRDYAFVPKGASPFCRYVQIRSHQSLPFLCKGEVGRLAASEGYVRGRKTRFSVLRLLCQDGNISRCVYKLRTPLTRRICGGSSPLWKDGSLWCARVFPVTCKFPLPPIVGGGILRQSRKTGEFAWCVRTYNTHLWKEGSGRKRKRFLRPFARGRTLCVRMVRCAHHLLITGADGLCVPANLFIPQKRLRRFL